MELLTIPILLLVLFMNWVVKHTSNGTRTFFDPSIYPWTSELTANWRQIRAELDTVAIDLDAIPNYQDISAELRDLTNDDKWKTFVLSMLGKRVQRNCVRCPKTALLLEKIPGLAYAMFSVLKPHKHIPSHRGYYRGLLNCHLALIVPEKPKECGLLVGSDTANWEEGHMLIFDDRHKHEAWNDSDSVRTVLLMYAVRPLPWPLSALNRFTLFLGSKTTYTRKLIDLADTISAP